MTSLIAGSVVAPDCLIARSWLVGRRALIRQADVVETAVLTLQDHKEVARAFIAQHPFLRSQVPPFRSNLSHKYSSTRTVGRFVLRELKCDVGATLQVSDAFEGG